MENATAWAPQIRATGEVREPFPRSASAPVAMDDIAAVAAVVLMADEGTYDGRALPLTGPETLTRVELVRRIGDALGRHIPFVEVSRDDAVEAFTSAMGDGAAWYVDNVLAGFAEHPMQATGVVQELTGAPATTFAQWAHAQAALFR